MTTGTHPGGTEHPGETNRGFSWPSDKRGESDRKKQRDIAAKSNQRQRDINIQSDVTTKEEGNTTLFCVGKATARRILFFFS